MAQTGSPRSRPGWTAGIRRLPAVLAVGVLTLTLVGSGNPGSAGAVQPAAAAVPATPGSAGAANALAASPSPSDLAPVVAAPGSPVASSAPPIASSGGALGTGSSAPPASAPPTTLDAEPAPIPAAALQARLDQIRVKNLLPGVSATIIWPDGRTWTGVSGWADFGRRAKLYPGTAFSIGSVSKTFLAALVLELVQEGRLTLDDTVRQWLPAARVSTKVTIRELLDHTSGLYDFFENRKIDTALLARRSRVWTAAMALSYVKTPYCAPGTCWVYSNTNYVLLGQIVQRVTGHSPTSELRQRFFDPLGLTRTFVQGVEPRRGGVAIAYKIVGPVTNRHRYNLSDGTKISPFTSVVTAAGTAGDIASSSGDLARWARALYGGSVLTPESLATMLDTSRSRLLHAPSPYGFAENTIRLNGRLTYGHNGRLIGSRASIRYLPESGFTVAVVTNQDVLGPDVFGTALLNIAFAALPPPPPPPPPDPTPSPSPSPSVAPPGG